MTLNKALFQTQLQHARCLTKWLQSLYHSFLIRRPPRGVEEINLNIYIYIYICFRTRLSCQYGQIRHPHFSNNQSVFCCVHFSFLLRQFGCKWCICTCHPLRKVHLQQSQQSLSNHKRRGQFRPLHDLESEVSSSLSVADRKRTQKQALIDKLNHPRNSLWIAEEILLTITF